MKSILIKVYKMLPFKKKAFEFLKLFWIPPHSIYKHLHFIGIIIVKVSETAAFKMQHYGTEIKNDLFLPDGRWERVCMQYWIQLCRRAEVIGDRPSNSNLFSRCLK